MIFALAAITCHTGAVVSLHRGFFIVVIAYSALMALWGFFLYFRGSNPTGSYLGSLILAESVAVLQGVIGLVLLLQGHRPEEVLHYVYGIAAALALPTAYMFGSGGRERRDSLIFALAALFLIGLAIRASVTGCTS